MHNLAKISLLITAFLSVVLASAAQAAPVLQVGAPGGPGQGTYANYPATLTGPTETDSATTSGDTIFVAGLYQNDNVTNLGGKYSTGLDWSDFLYPVAFNNHGAVLVAAVPNGQRAAAVSALTVNGQSSFYSSDTLSGLFPNTHDPLKDAVSDFLFFDIGTFAKTTLIPDFADETTGNKLGEIKTLTLGGASGFSWIHFDALALQTTYTPPKNNSPGNLTVALQNNPASHDLTRKLPEPASYLLFAAGLLGLLAFRAVRPAIS